jgi:hypothetical protein
MRAPVVEKVEEKKEEGSRPLGSDFESVGNNVGLGEISSAAESTNALHVPSNNSHDIALQLNVSRLWAAGNSCEKCFI